MDHKPALQRNYALLCQRFGELSYQKTIIDQELAELQVQLKGIDFSQGILDRIAAQLSAKNTIPIKPTEPPKVDK